MLSLKYLGIYALTLPEEISLEDKETLGDVMAEVIEASNMPDEFFWERHLVLLNGNQAELDEPVSDGDLLQVLSYSEGG